jgi:hypothetical protein
MGFFNRFTRKNTTNGKNATMTPEENLRKARANYGSVRKGQFRVGNLYKDPENTYRDPIRAAEHAVQAKLSAEQAELAKELAAKLEKTNPEDVKQIKEAVSQEINQAEANGLSRVTFTLPIYAARILQVAIGLLGFALFWPALALDMLSMSQQGSETIAGRVGNGTIKKIGNVQGYIDRRKANANNKKYPKPVGNSY